jgi:membrane protein
MSSANPVHAPRSPRPRHSRDGESKQSSARPRAVGVAEFVKRNAGIIKDAGVRWSDDACYRLGASLAYYAIFSIFPLLLVAVTALGFVLGNDPASRERILGSVSKVLSPQFRSLLDDTLANMQSHQTARGVGAVVGVVTLVFGASGVFSELESALDTIWRVRAEPSTGFRTTILRAVKSKATSFAAVACAGVVLLASLVVSAALAAFGGAAEHIVPNAMVWRTVDALVSLGLATLLFAVIFRVLPRADVTWRDVLGGAFFTALLFGVLKHLLAWNLGHMGSYAAYGAVGAVLGLLTWIYLMSLVLLFGAELTRVYAEREGSLARQSKRTP